MLQVVWNVFKSVYSLLCSVFRPFRRLVCRRRRSSESDGSELTSIGTGDLRIDTPSSYGQVNAEEEELEMEAWDSWNEPPVGGGPEPPQAGFYPGPGPAQSQGANGAVARPGVPSSSIQNYYYNQKMSQPEPEPEPNFFQDMTPDVKKQPKILIRKKESPPPSTTGSLMNRMTVMSDVPALTSELGEWEDGTNAWDTGEALEDLTWQAEEAIKEKKKKERMERQLEQQRRKQKKEEMRGMKNSGVFKLS